MRRHEQGRKTFRVVYPDDVKHQDKVKFFQAMSGALPKPAPFSPLQRVVLEVLGEAGKISHYLTTPAHLSWLGERLLPTEIKGAYVEEVPQPPIATKRWTRGTSLLTTSLWLPFHFADHDGVVSSLLGAFVSHAPGEEVALQLMVAHTRPPTKAEGWKPKKKDDQEGAKDKLTGAYFTASVRIAARGRGARGRINQVFSAFAGTSRDGNHWKRLPLSSAGTIRRMASQTGALAHLVQLSVDELSVFSAVPSGNLSIPNLPKARTQHLDPSMELARGPIMLGTSTTPNNRRAVGFGEKDATHHFHVIGGTGLGKSTLLASVAVQWFRRGRGGFIVDPHGDLNDDILKAMPPERAGDVILLDPLDAEWTVPFDLFTGNPMVDTSSIMSVLDNLFRISSLARGVHIARDAIHTVAAHNMSLFEIPRLLGANQEGKELRKILIDNLPRDEKLYQFWHDFDRLKPADQIVHAEPLLRRLGALEAWDTLRYAFSLRAGAHRMEDIIARRQILLVSTRKGKTGSEVSNFFGALLFTRLAAALYARSKSDRTPFLIGVDEFHNFMGAVDFDVQLAEIRKYGGVLFLMHQYMNQLDPGIRTSVMPNAKNKIIFPSSAMDAREMVRELGDRRLKDTDPLTLGRWQAIARLVSDGHATAPVTIDTLAPPEPTGMEEEIRRASHERYGRRIAELKREHLARTGGRRREAPRVAQWEPEP
ncbi:hypothetical protein CcI156_05900 [Frankia sp. CcI156]|nr:hypothetical protein CcI156_05900 [Frankia sp. CcI156]